MFMQQIQKIYAVTRTVCISIASRIHGAIVNEVFSLWSLSNLEVRSGHSAGLIWTEASVKLEENDFVMKLAILGRTARQIMEGLVYFRD